MKHYTLNPFMTFYQNIMFLPIQLLMFIINAFDNDKEI